MASSCPHCNLAHTHHDRCGHKPQNQHYYEAVRKSSAADQTMMDLLYGPNPISDAELRALIKKRPHVYGKYASYLGKRR